MNSTLVYLLIIVNFFLYFSCSTFKDHSQTNSRSIKKCLKEENAVIRIDCLSEVIKEYPSNSHYYFLRGCAFQEILKFTSAIKDFKKVIELEPSNTRAYYYLAVAASLATHKQYALFWLERCFESGFQDFELIENDKSLDNIRDTDEFNFLLKKWNHKPLSSLQHND